MNQSVNKRILVLAGGSSFGAFQAGVVRELAEKGIQWDAIYGTSVGAINGAYLASLPKEFVRERSIELCNFWSTTNTSDIYKFTFKNFSNSLCFWKPLSITPSIFDTTPLRRLIYRHLNPKPQTPLRIFVTPVLGGPLVIADEFENDIRPWVMASSAVPILFPPVSINGIIYMDGGVRQNNPMAYSMRNGLVDVDVVLCFPATCSSKESRKIPLLTVAYKALRAATDQFLEGEAFALKAAHPDNVRIYRPESLFPHNPFEFNPEVSKKLIELGRQSVLSTPCLNHP